MLLAVYAGWNGWQYWQRKQAAQATALYEEVERIAAGGDAARLDRALADMKDKFGGTAQAQQAALLVAAAHVRRVGTRPRSRRFAVGGRAVRRRGLPAVARLRLAGLLLDAKSYDEALKQLSGSFPAEFDGVGGRSPR